MYVCVYACSGGILFKTFLQKPEPYSMSSCNDAMIPHLCDSLVYFIRVCELFVWLVAIRHDSEHQKSIRVHINLRVEVCQLSQCNELLELRTMAIQLPSLHCRRTSTCTWTLIYMYMYMYSTRVMTFSCKV